MRPRSTIPDLSHQGKIPSTSGQRKKISDPIANIRRQYQEKQKKYELMDEDLYIMEEVDKR